MLCDMVNLVFILINPCESNPDLAGFDQSYPPRSNLAVLHIPVAVRWEVEVTQDPLAQTSMAGHPRYFCMEPGAHCH